MVKTEITTQNDLVTNSTRGIRKYLFTSINCHTKCLLLFRPSYKMLIGIPVKDISYNLNVYVLTLICGWGRGRFPVVTMIIKYTSWERQGNPLQLLHFGRHCSKGSRL